MEPPSRSTNSASSSEAYRRRARELSIAHDNDTNGERVLRVGSQVEDACDVHEHHCVRLRLRRLEGRETVMFQCFLDLFIEV